MSRKPCTRTIILSLAHQARTSTGNIPTRLSSVFRGDGWSAAKASVVAHDGKILYDVSIDWAVGAHDATRHPLLEQKRLAKARRLAGTSVVLATSESTGFFHWMTDALPRLQILRKACPIPWEAIDHFLVSEGIPAIRESLALLGIRDIGSLLRDSDSHFPATSWSCHRSPAAPGNVPPWAIEFLRSQLGISPLGHESEFT